MRGFKGELENLDASLGLADLGDLAELFSMAMRARIPKALKGIDQAAALSEVQVPDQYLAGCRSVGLKAAELVLSSVGLGAITKVSVSKKVRIVFEDAEGGEGDPDVLLLPNRKGEPP